MNDLVVILVTQDLLDLRGFQAHDLSDLIGGVVDQPLGNRVSQGIDAGDRVSKDEISLDLRDAGGKEALAVPDDGLLRAFIDENPSPRTQGKCDPVFPAVQVFRRGQKKGSRLLAVQDFLQDTGSPAGGDDVRNARCGDLFRGLNLAFHAAHADGGGLLCRHSLDFRGEFGHDGDQLCLLRCGGILVVEAFGTRQIDHQVGLDDVGDHRGQVVVVAEFDLVDGHRVVLIDDRDDAPIHQCEEGIADVQKALAVGDVAHREKNLADEEAVFSEGVGIDAHQPPLTDRGGRLLLRNALQFSLDAHPVFPGGDRSGADQNDLESPFAKGCDVGHQLLDDVEFEAVLTRQDGAADLDEDPPDPCKIFLACHDEISSVRMPCFPGPIPGEEGRVVGV